LASALIIRREIKMPSLLIWYVRPLRSTTDPASYAAIDLTDTHKHMHVYTTHCPLLLGL
jgi:hypothetical protein